MKTSKEGLTNGFIAFFMWGVYPLYWWLLSNISGFEILINRMLFSFLTLVVLILVMRKLPDLKNALLLMKQQPKKILLMIGATLLIGINWYTFTHAVTSNQFVAVSLGYYINPLLNVLIGVFFLKEKLNKYQAIAVLIAFIGIAYLSISYGQLPIVSLVLAITFSLYSLVKKFIGIDAIISLFFETGLMLPVSTYLFITTIQNGTSHFAMDDIKIQLLLVGTGMITMSPLIYFTKAARLLELKILGFLQYLAPTLQMLVAVFIIGEPFSTNRLITFICIWIACLLFSMSHYLDKKPLLQLKKT